MLSPKWRSILSLKWSFTSASTTCTNRLSQFHSTSVLSEKSRNNIGRTSQCQRSSKDSSVKFTCTVKEKGRRTGAKKTLDNLLYHRGLNDPLQNEWNFGPNPLIRDRHMKKKAPPGQGKKPRDKKTKRWHREGNTDDEFRTDANNNNNTFNNKWRDASKNQYQKRDSTSGFEWREGWSWTSQSQRSNTWNDEPSDDEPLIVRPQSDRNVLGLPLSGPLKLEDVKKAFRSSALKWHPDKHQGSSKTVAEEKFKLCVDAYNSLSSAFS